MFFSISISVYGLSVFCICVFWESGALKGFALQVFVCERTRACMGGSASSVVLAFGA